MGPRRLVAASALALVLCAAGAAALYEKGSPVVQLTHRSFDKVLQSHVPTVVEFFAPWCGHCKNLAPAYTTAAEKLQGIVPFVAVDCDREANRPLCGQYGVQGFPTIKLFTPGSATPEDYNGPRTAKALADAAVGLLTSKHVKQLKSQASALAWVQSNPGMKVVVVTDKAKASPMIKSLSQRFHGQGLKFAQLVVGPEEQAQLAALGIGKTPALVALKGSDLSERTLYEGELKAPRILDWLKQAEQGSKAEAGKEGKKEQKEKVPAEIPQVVSNVTAAELARRLEKEGVVVVSFFAGYESACRAPLNQLNAAVHGLHGLATGVQVDLTSAKEAAAVKDLYSVELPALGDTSCSMKTFLLPFDPEDHEDADEWREYPGELSSKELHKAAIELFPSAGISPLTAETHRQWMGSEPQRVKVVLFTDKEDPPALFRALSANFRKFKFNFGMLHSSQAALLKEFRVEKIPAIVIAFLQPGPGGKPPQPGKDAQFVMQPYTGPMRYGSIASFLLMAGLQTGTASEEALEQFTGRKPADAMVAQITDQESWDASCLSKGGVCIVAALSAGEEQAKQLGVLRAVAEGRADQPLHFCWFEAGAAAPPAARGFAAALGLDGGQVPALVAVAPKKERSAIMTARFEKDSVKEWLDGLLSGKVRTSPLQQLPVFPAAGEGGAADGAAAAEGEAVEEEFDLSDIMNEEIAGDVSKGAVHDEL